MTQVWTYGKYTFYYHNLSTSICQNTTFITLVLLNTTSSTHIPQEYTAKDADLNILKLYMA